MFNTPPAQQLPQAPKAPDKPPMFGQQTMQTRKQPMSQQPTFLGADARPGLGQLGQKTLLGQ